VRPDGSSVPSVLVMGRRALPKGRETRKQGRGGGRVVNAARHVVRAAVKAGRLDGITEGDDGIVGNDAGREGRLDGMSHLVTRTKIAARARARGVEAAEHRGRNGKAERASSVIGPHGYDLARSVHSRPLTAIPREAPMLAQYGDMAPDLLRAANWVC
jgi:hypothetical protein